MLPLLQHVKWLLVAVIFAANGLGVPAASRTTSQSNPARVVYAALLDSLVRGDSTDTLIVAESSDVFRAPLVVAPHSFYRDYEFIPPGLPEALERLTHPARPSSSLPLPRPVHILTAAEVQSFSGGGPDVWWNAFYQRFPVQRQFVALSPVAFSADSATALVSFAVRCGGLCGTGRLVWLERKPTGAWFVRRAYSLWFN